MKKKKIIFLSMSFLLVLLSGILATIQIQRSQHIAHAAQGWEVVSNSNTGKLNDVAAVNPSNVLAVGHTATKGLLVQQWNGSQISTSNPLPEYPDFSPTKIKVIDVNNIWVVGANNSSDTKPFIVHFDGSTWQRVATPEVGTDLILYDITASSATDIWAMGQGRISPLLMHYDGSVWSIVENPSALSQIRGIVYTCMNSSNDLWASGYSSGKNWLIHYNGTEWTITETSNSLKLECKSSNNVWGLKTGNATGQDLVHFDGTAWNPVLTTDGYKLGFTVIENNDIWIVGSQEGDKNTLTEHSDGSQSTIISSPNGEGAVNQLTAVSAINGDVWTVGYSSNSALVLRYTATADPEPSPTEEQTATPTATNTPQTSPTETSSPTPENKPKEEVLGDKTKVSTPENKKERKINSQQLKKDSIPLVIHIVCIIENIAALGSACSLQEDVSTEIKSLCAIDALFHGGKNTKEFDFCPISKEEQA